MRRMPLPTAPQSKRLAAVLKCRPTELAAGFVQWRLSERSQSRGTMVDCGGLTAK
jgi:hypothetical protein